MSELLQWTDLPLAVDLNSTLASCYSYELLDLSPILSTGPPMQGQRLPYACVLNKESSRSCNWNLTGVVRLVAQILLFCTTSSAPGIICVFLSLLNPRRAHALARVTVVRSVCLCVCLSVRTKSACTGI